MVNEVIIDKTTINSLLAAITLFTVAFSVSSIILPQKSSTRTRILFVWHLFDVLIHSIFEGSFLYNCFFTYLYLTGPPGYIAHVQNIVTPPGVFFKQQPDRLYGPAYGQSPTAKLWQEYAKADHRWGGADLTIISIELLTVFGAGPLAAYVCYLLVQGHGDAGTGLSNQAGRLSGKIAFWMIVLATGELYGGFMTFSPEWLSGSPNLNTDNWMYLWLYLFFFNMLWVIVPFYVLYEAYRSLNGYAPLDLGTKEGRKVDRLTRLLER